MKTIYRLIASIFLLTSLTGFAQEPATATAEQTTTVLVLMPERVDVEWFWYHYGVGDDMVVQRSVEKALLRDDIDIVDATSTDAFPSGLTIDRMLQKKTALEIAKELGATHLILGKAIAVHGSKGTAYGVNVYRSNVEITARLLRVADGKVLDVLDENVTEGDQSQRTAARNALKAGGKKIARKLVRAVTKNTAPAE